MNFTDHSISQSEASVERINEFVTRLDETEISDSIASETNIVQSLVNETRMAFVEAMEDDLDAPTALASVFEFISEGNKILDGGNPTRKEIDLMLDFMLNDFNAVFGVVKPVTKPEELTGEIRELLRKREEVRKKREWAKSDALREELLALGIEVQDTPEGQRWRKKSAKS
ncbi:MAG: hypothetical protein M1587_06320 [Thaumarchaeota archaeon]|nr:hypothetical protein [Nitrososphaerota archaeon]